MIIERALKEKKLINKEAIIDLGSNSIRMLIYDNLLNSQIPVFNEKAICELGKNLDKTGKLDPKGSDFALSVLQRFKRILSNLKVKKFKIIGTAAIREATDSKLFVAKVQKILKKKVEVLTGIKEAENSALGVIIGFQRVNGVVVDLGGGSLELARVEKNIIYEKVSLPLGVLRLFNQPKRNKDKINSIISFYLNKIEWLRKGKTKNLYLCGGTWRTLLNAHIFKTNYPLSILHQYKLPAIEALKFSNRLSSVKLIKLEKLVGVTKSRTNYIPIGSYILSSLIKICDPSNILCSVSGVREGSLINKAYLNILKKDSLNRSVHFIALKKGDFGENYIKLYNFLKKIFPNKDENFPIRLLLPACSLSNFDWGLGTYQRAELVFHEVINSPILKLSHNDRIKLGLVSFWRHCSTKYYPDLEFLKLLSNSEITACRRIGAALRFASSISVISSIFYEKIKIYVANEKTLILKVPKKYSQVISNQVQKRLKSLAEEMNLKQEIVYTD
jgi:exopolyphosphatase/guanosine-5'-triphosphate,3'-diphosphate pyrophosphatase